MFHRNDFIMSSTMSNDDITQVVSKVQLFTANVDVNKKRIVNAVCGYALTMGQSMFGGSTDPQRYAICTNIFSHLDLPTLLFAQHVINQINTIWAFNSSLRTNVLPIAIDVRSQSLPGYTLQTQRACFGLAATAFFASFYAPASTASALFSLSAILFTIGMFAPERAAIFRLDRAIMVKQHNAQGQQLAMLDDGLDDVIERFANSGGRLLGTGVRFIGAVTQLAEERMRNFANRVEALQDNSNNERPALR